jgi:hypothetical protein
MKHAVVAGNGRFPILVLEEARRLGLDVTVIGVKGEASAEIEALAPAPHWVGIGQLGKLIEILHQENAKRLILAGQVKHASIFSGALPDWRMAKLLAGLALRNTDALLGAVVETLREEGIEVVESTVLLASQLATEGVMSRRHPATDEEADAAYGRTIAAALSSFDIGQSVVICERACVALEAMEGTDAILRRAAILANGKRLTLVKGSGRRRHMLFDVPVVGVGTIETMKETGATMLAVDAGRTLLIDKSATLAAADAAGIVVVGTKDE